MTKNLGIRKNLLVLLILLPIPAVGIRSFAATAWWERETRMQEGGKLFLSEKKWWPQAKELESGQQIIFVEGVPGEPPSGPMVIRKEKRKKDPSQEMIVWILDDDGDLNIGDGSRWVEGDTDSDCYVVDYGCDGSVDRMVDYIDVDGDQVADEMDIRYFVEGELRRCWFGVDLDEDGRMWDLIDYEYTGDFFASDPYGNNMIYMNKYDPDKNRWLPISECPFAFYDTDGDRQSDVVVRFSAAPLDFSEHEDPDYANSRKRYEGPFYPALEKIGIMNIRYSFDIDGLNSEENPLHYEMGFNLIGAQPYEIEGMKHKQPLRRPPKTTVCVPYEKVREVAENYRADQTGFTWREFEDAALKIGHPSRPEYDRRWEGVFWTWHRRIMQNTGGPVQDWNVRREFRSTPASKREVYYSPVDRRIHLKGAEEGWIQVGHFFGKERLMEIRMFDQDGDGYFDRWEVVDGASGALLRVSQVCGIENRDLGNDWKTVQAFYTKTVLPEALRLNESLIAAFESILPGTAYESLASLKERLQEPISPDEKRYLQDIIRETLYQAFRHLFETRNQKELTDLPEQDPRFAPEIIRSSTTTWERIVFLSRLDSAYGRGDYRTVLDLLNREKDRLVEN